MKSVAFVCTANMCRSPMAEALFQKLVRERGQADEWWIDSAGVSASEGQPATGETQRVAAERGIDLSSHRSTLASARQLEPFGLILVMEEAHRQALLERAPELADRIHLLSEMAGEATDIQDPVGTGIGNYRAMADRMEGTLRSGFDRISELARRAHQGGRATPSIGGDPT
jgi:protein-tyrosine-phosphatase